MLTPEQMQRLGEETEDVYDDIEMEMLAASAKQLSRLEPSDDGSIPWGAIIGGAAALSMAHKGILNSYAKDVSAAVNRDTSAAFTLNAATELTGGEPNAASIMAEAKAMAQTLAPTITQNLLRNNQNIVNMANTAYYNAAAKAAQQVAHGINAKTALANSVSQLARQGVTFSTYTRVVNGIPQEVHVPVDVGIRREVFTDINDRLTQQIFDIAGQTDCNLVEVSFTMAPRESHAEWEGQIYQLNGAGEYQNFYVACKYGDPVEGYGGYNCGHSMALYRGYRHFKDPLKGTGYTKEEAYALTQRQRYFENEIRKDKREIAARKVVGVSTDAARAKLANHQRQLDALVSQHRDVLIDQRWRTRIYEQANYAEGKLGGIAIGKDRARIVYNDALRSMHAEISTFKKEVEKALKPYRQWSERALDTAANKVSKQKQNRHIRGTKEYVRHGETQREKVAKRRAADFEKRAVSRGDTVDSNAVLQWFRERLANMNPSYMVLEDGEIQALVDYYAGTGVPRMTKAGTWNKIEYCVAGEIVGVVVDSYGMETPTRAFVIKYGKNNVHVQPVLEE